MFVVLDWNLYSGIQEESMHATNYKKNSKIDVNVNFPLYLKNNVSTLKKGTDDDNRRQICSFPSLQHFIALFFNMINKDGGTFHNGWP